MILTIEKLNSNSYTAAKEHELYVKDIKHRKDINKMLLMQRRR